MTLSWLAGPTEGALRAALRAVVPDLADGMIVPRGLEPAADPLWRTASAVLDGRFVAKFAWAEPPARRIWYQATILDALRTAAPLLPLPVVVAASRDPAMLVTRRVDAVPFFDLRTRPAPVVARDLATALAHLHGALEAVSAALGPLPAPTLPATTGTLRARFGALVRPDQRDRILGWCDHVDRALASPGRAVLVHGDFHGDNHLWDRDPPRLRLVIDLETAGAGEPEFDLRCLPGDCGTHLFLAVVARYETLTGTTLDVERVMAWHLRTVLGDALWRAEAGVALPDHRTPSDWVDDLAARLSALGVFS